MHYAIVTLQECFDFLVGKTSIEQLDVRLTMASESLPNSNEIVLVWSARAKDTKVIPETILLPDSTKREFLAWTHTYLTSHMPIGAFMHIVDSRAAQIIFRETHHGTASDSLLALPVAEAALNSEIKSDFTLISSAARSCSFAAIRAFATGYTWDSIARAIDYWWTIRELFNLPPARLGRIEMKDTFSILFNRGRQHSLGMDDPTVRLQLRMIQEYKDRKDVSAQTWAEVTSDLPFRLERAEVTEGPREARVPHLQRLIEAVSGNPSRIPSAITCFIGYVVNQLAPGTLEHLRILRPLASSYPSAFLWYAVFAGLYGSGPSKGYFSSPIAGLLKREIDRPAWSPDRPTCDITADEVFMMHEANGNIPKVRSLVPNHITIALLPGVDTVLYLTRDIGHVSEGRSEGDLRAVGDNLLESKKQLESKLTQAYETLDQLRAQLEWLGTREVSVPERRPQRDLFTQPRSGRNRRSKKKPA